MKTTLKKAASLLIAISALVSSHVAQAVIVYDNSTAFISPPNRLNATNQVGDEIILGGTARALTNFTFQYSTTNWTGFRSAELRFYRKDGPVVSGNITPGSSLFDSGLFLLPAAPGALNVTFDSDFGINGLVVPDRFIWSLQFFGLTGNEEAGPDLFNPVTVGSNFPDYWIFEGGAWALRTFTNGNPVNFAARAQAAQGVPDPASLSTIALSVMGVLGFGLKTRKQR